MLSFTQLRVLTGNLIGFGWVIFITMKRRKLQKQLDTANAANRTRIIVTDSESASSTGTTKKKPRSKDSNWIEIVFDICGGLVTVEFMNFSSEFWWGIITYEQFHVCLNFIPFKLFWWSFFSLFPIRKIISHISKGGLLVYCSNRHMMIVHNLWTFYINTFVVSLSIKTFSSKKKDCVWFFAEHIS